MNHIVIDNTNHRLIIDGVIYNDMPFITDFDGVVEFLAGLGLHLE